MGIDAYLVDRKTSQSGSVHKGDTEGDKSGIVAYTEDFWQYRLNAGFLTDDSGSIEMAIDASISGTPEVVYLDEPTTNWTNTALLGTWDFSSTTITAQGGSHSIDATATVNGDQAQMERSSTINLSGYTAFSGYVYLSSYNDSRHQILVEIKNAGVTVGTSINIADFIDTGVIGSWQKFIIPKEEMGINGDTIDQVVFTTVSSSGVPPAYYLDTINIEETGGKLFSFGPNKNEFFDIHTVILSFRDGITVIEPSNFMGLGALTTGIRIRTVVDGVTSFSGGIKTMHEIITIGLIEDSRLTGAAEMAISFAGGPAGAGSRLDGNTGDTYSFFISDNLAALSSFRCIVRGRKVR